MRGLFFFFCNVHLEGLHYPKQENPGWRQDGLP